MERRLENILPILGVEQDCILSRQGDVTLGYKVELPEIFTMSNADYEAFHQTWIKAIKILPKHCVFHKQDWYIETSYKLNFKEDMQFLSRSSERFFNERPYLDHECYIFITKKPGNKKSATSMMSGLLRKSIVPQPSINQQMLQEFFESCGQFERILKDSGFVLLNRLPEESLISSKDKAGVIEKYCFLLEDNDAATIKDIQFRNEFKIGDDYCQLYTLADINDLPGLCGSRINYDKYSTDKTKFSVAFTSVLGQLLPCSHIYNQFIFVDDAQKTLKKLEGKRLRLQSLSAYSRENAIAKEGVDAFLNEAISEQRQPVKAHFNLLVWTDSRDKLKELRNMVSSALAQMDATPKQETSGAAQIWWAGMPGNEADFPMNDTFDTFIEQAVCFLNLETNYRCSLSPVGLRLGDRLTGKPVHADISDEPVTKGICTNRNKFILGPSGSGKSFFTNHMVRSYYEQGTHIVLVDVGHSYKGLCDLVKGYYFTYSESDPIRFNPFYIPNGDILDTEKKESIKTLLLALWKKSDESYNRSEYVALSNALQLYYDKLNKDDSIFPCVNSF
jgi:conjugation system TraG family ATPase